LIHIQPPGNDLLITEDGTVRLPRFYKRLILCCQFLFHKNGRALTKQKGNSTFRFMQAGNGPEKEIHKSSAQRKIFND